MLLVMDKALAWTTLFTMTVSLPVLSRHCIPQPFPWSMDIVDNGSDLMSPILSLLSTAFPVTGGIFQWQWACEPSLVIAFHNFSHGAWTLFNHSELMSTLQVIITALFIAGKLPSKGSHPFDILLLSGSGVEWDHMLLLEGLSGGFLVTQRQR